MGCGRSKESLTPQERNWGVTPLTPQQLSTPSQHQVNSAPPKQDWGIHPATQRSREIRQELPQRLTEEQRSLSLERERSSLPSILAPPQRESSFPPRQGLSQSIRRQPTADEGGEQPYTPRTPQQQRRASPKGIQSPFASLVAQQGGGSTSFSSSSSASLQSRASPPEGRPSASRPRLGQQGEASSPYTPCERGCRCMYCRPDFYTVEGILATTWSSPCPAERCRCPVCTEHCDNGGHMLPKLEQCRRRLCECRNGCMDNDCPRCRAVLSRDRSRTSMARLTSTSMTRINSGESLARTDSG